MPGLLLAALAAAAVAGVAEAQGGVGTCAGYANASVLVVSGGSWSAGWYHGVRFVASRNGPITALGLHTLTTGTQARLAVYTDNAGTYGTLIAQTDAYTTVAAAGSPLASPSVPVRSSNPVPGDLVAGQTYWVVGIWDTGGFQVYADNAAERNVFNNGAFPSTFPSTLSSSGTFSPAFGYFADCDLVATTTGTTTGIVSSTGVPTTGVPTTGVPTTGVPTTGAVPTTTGAVVGPVDTCAGFPNASGATNLRFSANWYVGVSFVASRSGPVESLGVHTLDAGTNARLAVYTDNAGVYGTLVAQTDVFQTVAASGTPLMSPSIPVRSSNPVPGSVVAGQTYWVVVIYMTATRTYVDTGVSRNDYNNNAFPSEFPANLPSGLTSTSGAPLFFLNCGQVVTTTGSTTGVVSSTGVPTTGVPTTGAPPAPTTGTTGTPITGCGSLGSECTTFAAGNGQEGAAFTVQALQTTTVSGLEFVADGAGTAEVWYRTGTVSTSLVSSTVGWTNLRSGVSVGSGRQSLCFSSPLTLTAGQNYVFVVRSTGNIDYTTGSTEFTGSRLVINAGGNGLGLGGFPTTDTYSPRMWNGCFLFGNGTGSSSTTTGSSSTTTGSSSTTTGSSSTTTGAAAPPPPSTTGGVAPLTSGTTGVATCTLPGPLSVAASGSNVGTCSDFASLACCNFSNPSYPQPADLTTGCNEQPQFTSACAAQLDALTCAACDPFQQRFASSAGGAVNICAAFADRIFTACGRDRINPFCNVVGDTYDSGSFLSQLAPLVAGGSRPLVRSETADCFNYGSGGSIVVDAAPASLSPSAAVLGLTLAAATALALEG